MSIIFKHSNISIKYPHKQHTLSTNVQVTKVFCSILAMNGCLMQYSNIQMENCSKLQESTPQLTPIQTAAIDIGLVGQSVLVGERGSGAWSYFGHLCCRHCRRCHHLKQPLVVNANTVDVINVANIVRMLFKHTLAVVPHSNRFYLHFLIKSDQAIKRADHIIALQT